MNRHVILAAAIVLLLTGCGDTGPKHANATEPELMDGLEALFAWEETQNEVFDAGFADGRKAACKAAKEINPRRADEIIRDAAERSDAYLSRDLRDKYREGFSEGIRLIILDAC